MHTILRTQRCGGPLSSLVNKPCLPASTGSRWARILCRNARCRRACHYRRGPRPLRAHWFFFFFAGRVPSSDPANEPCAGYAPSRGGTLSSTPKQAMSGHTCSCARDFECVRTTLPRLARASCRSVIIDDTYPRRTDGDT
jgi:hypothetical protein